MKFAMILFSFLLFLLCVGTLWGNNENHVGVDADDPVIKQLSSQITDLKSKIVYLESKGARSCHELKAMTGIDTSGEFLIDPAKTGAPIKVYCEMESGETWIGHDGEELAAITYCKGTGCFNKKYVYRASDDQIEALKAISETCYQEIKFECNMAPLRYLFHDITTYSGWWTGNDGFKKTYFDGNDEESNVCGCYATNTCKFGSTCNCLNLRRPTWQSDEGKLTNKTSLPVRSFVYGDFLYNQDEGKITVGKLKCTARNYEAAIDNDKELADVKEMTARNYKALIDNKKEVSELKETFEEMTARNYKAAIDNKKEVSELKETFAFACGYKDTFSHTAKTITYDKLTINERGNMLGAGELNAETGVYTSPLGGIYTFSWSASCHNEENYNVNIYLRINGTIISESRHYSIFRGSSGYSFDMAGRTMILHLNKGDTADLFCQDCPPNMFFINFCVTMNHGDA